MENHFIILCCFCHTTMQYMYNSIYIPPSWAASPPPAHPSRSWQRTRQGSLCYSSISHMMVYVCQCYFFNSSHPLLPLHVWLLKMLDLFLKRLTNLYSRNKKQGHVLIKFESFFLIQPHLWAFPVLFAQTASFPDMW